MDPDAIMLAPPESVAISNVAVTMFVPTPPGDARVKIRPVVRACQVPAVPDVKVPDVSVARSHKVAPIPVVVGVQ